MRSLRPQFSQVKSLVEQHQSFVILTHKNPDGDTLGSGLALHHHLKSRGKHSRIVCKTPVPESLFFLPGIDDLKDHFDPHEFDLIISCDSAAPHLTGFHEEWPDIFAENTEYQVINIDHHASSHPFGSLRIIEDTAASTANICYELFVSNGWRITPKIATCLLTGVITDTGSFMHSNTDTNTLRVAARLLALGADLNSIRKDVFCTKNISTLRLWGRVFDNMDVDPETKVVTSAITEKDFKECEADPAELTGVVDYMNSLQGMNFSLLLTEQDKKVKGSLRTMQEEVDVAEIAAKIGGGGHRKAAGFAIPGKLESYKAWKVVEEEEEEEDK